LLEQGTSEAYELFASLMHWWSKASMKRLRFFSFACAALDQGKHKAYYQLI
jgi:hypothetical protein